MKRNQPIQRCNFRPFSSGLFALTLIWAAAAPASAAVFETDFNSGLPVGTQVYGNAAVDATGGLTNSGCLKLTSAVASQSGSFVLTSDLDSGAQVYGFMARFKAYVGGGNGADGFSFSFAADLPAGGFAEEGAGTGLSICFDTYSNEVDNIGVELKAYGSSFQNVPGVPIRAGTFVDVLVHLKPNGYLDVFYDGTYVFTNHYLGFTPNLGSRFGFGSRTGGANDNHWIDDLSIVTYTNQPAVVDFYRPIGRAARPDSPVEVVLLDIGTAVQPGSISLKFDGAIVTPQVTSTPPTTRVRYVPPVMFTSGSSHDLELIFSDNATPPRTTVWRQAFTVASYSDLSPSLIADPALVSANPGFKVRVSQIDANRGTSIQRAENQLAGLLIDPATGLPYVSRATLSATNETGVINYSTAGAQGSFPTEPPFTIPGLPGMMPDMTSTGDTNAALDVVTYLQLQPGFYSLGVNSSDGFRLTVASSPDLYAQELAIYDSVRAPADTITTFGVAQAGYYPFRIAYYIGGQEISYPTADVPSLEFFSVTVDGVKVLINDTASAGHLKAYLPAQTLPYVRSTSPANATTGVAKNTDVQVTIVDGSITVDPASAAVTMTLNGAAVTPTVTYGLTNAGVNVIRYQPTSPLPLNSSNYVEFAFTDGASNRRTNGFYFITENVLTQLFAIRPASPTNAVWAKWVTSSGTERGLAYNPKTGHVLIVSRNSATGVDGPNGCGVGIFDGETGLYIKQLSLNLPDGGTIPANGIGLFKLNMIDVADDGVIYACALQTSWAANQFAIYRWQNEDANPTIAVSSPQLGLATRVGDAFAVRGSGAGTQIIATGNTTATNIPIFTTIDGTNFTGTSLNITGLPGASVRLGLAFGCGNEIYGATTGAAFPMRHVSFTGPPATTGALLNNYYLLDAAKNPFIGPIGIDIGNRRVIGASTAGTGGAAHSMNLFDLEALVAGGTNSPVDSKPFPVSTGTFGTGSVDFTPDGTRVYTLDSGSGVIAFSLAPKLAAPSICAHPKDLIVAGLGSVGFMDANAIGSLLQYQWRLNGADIPGATRRTLDIYDVKNTDLGFYTVVIHNALGRQTSAPAMLDTRMIGNPTPQNQVIPVGGSGTISAGITGGLAPYTYQWIHNGVTVSGATTSSFDINAAQTSQAGAYTVAATDALGQSITSAVAVVTVGALGTGTGLLGQYFNVDPFTGNFPSNAFGGTPSLVRVDETVNFNWGTDGSPDFLITIDHFVARWHGQVQPIYSQPYTFYTRSDDGARLWVDGQLLVSRWVPQAPTEASGTIELVANQKYDIVMEYFERASGAVAELRWSSPNQVKEIIPKTQLYPGSGPLTPTLKAATVSGGSVVIDWVGTGTLESAPSVNGPWEAIVYDAVGPYTVPVGSGPALFYRLVSQQKPL